MNKIRFTIGFVFLFLTSFNLKSQTTIQIGSTWVGIDTVYNGLGIPWEVIYGPDNYLWVTERRGIVSRIDPLTHTKNVVLDLTASIYAQSEAGLLGMKLHPNFLLNKEVYLVYCYGPSTAAKERLVKYTYNNSGLISPQILIDSINANINHDGSRLLFLPDNTILMSTGDALNSSDAQNLNSRNGKILRVNTNGTIPANNPFPESYVYTFGHRNPQGLTIGPNGFIYESEHGPSNDDEFQIIESGRNYGWPNVEGFCNLPAEMTFCAANNVKEPLMNWTSTIAPSGIVYYINPAFPEFDNTILMAVLKDKKLVSIKLNAAGTASVSQTSYFANMFGRLRDVCVGPNSEIYIATNGEGNDTNTHTILRLSPPNILSVKENTTNNFHAIVYPTLVKDNLNVELQNPDSKQVVLKVTDITGNIILTEKFIGSSHQSSMANLSQGIYFLTLQEDSKQILVKKIIKE